MGEFERARWQRIVEWTAALALAGMWLVAGVWKLSDLTAMQVRLTHALVPQPLSLAAAVGLGVAETFAAILLLVPAWRRWGAWLSGLLLAVFMAYIGYHYRELTGEECSCFPWLKRAIGPAFFLQDGAMLLVAGLAGWWARPSQRWRAAGIVLAVILLLAGGLLAVSRAKGRPAEGPDSIVAEGREFPLRRGRVLLYFFNPLCPHCLQAAKVMSRLKWEATIIGVPTQDFEQSRGFFEDAGMRDIQLSPDAARLRQAFPFQDVPFAVALENGRVREKLYFFEEPRLTETLRQIGFAR